MSKIGIFGGSFNPIHIGHIALARQLLTATGLDEVWFVVSPLNPLKRDAFLLDDAKRLEMARLALQDEPRLTVSDIEFHLPRPSYMLHTLQALTHAYPQHRFFLLVGGDNWAAFDRWFGYREILAHYPVVVYPRGGYPVTANNLPPNVTLADTPLMDISSTQIRQNVRDGRSIHDMVPANIEALVVKNYQETAGAGETHR
ncbi:nicotinate-nucleotide adenylyltransferase [Prevotella sp. A2931]|uniref:Probable nicotinate-nucleotide adenylyltransferase n=1 Tax=Prevotella illustrans TaxID=2800387 RepID=A0ABS3M718_9BACT|nr:MULTISPECIES: nicotinate (nicotinamide) nucleotide adenylyltransferase [Prevotella]MBO1363983.1 nicotinate-nucleotide adenylyltransferase [Prevotella illustrans]PTL27013.1 nicotinate-nucleotide adenylyltransferase [Prevotella sp. oral taxon 820]